MSPIDESAFWRTLVDCKASRYLTASEVQFLLKYRGAVEANHAEHERQRAEFDYVGRMLAAACSAAPPTEEALTRLLERQPHRDATDTVIKAYVAAVRLYVNRAAVRDGLAATKHHKQPDRSLAGAAAATAGALDHDHFKKMLRKLDSKAHSDALETDLKCCHKLLVTLQGSHFHSMDNVGCQTTDEAKPQPKPKKHAPLQLPRKADASPAPANDHLVKQLFPLQKLVHTHPACERLNEDPAFRSGNLEDKIKYLLDLAHRRPAAATETPPEPLQGSQQQQRKTAATQCDLLRQADRRDVGVDAMELRDAKARRASEPSRPKPFDDRRGGDAAADDAGGRRVKGGWDEADGEMAEEEDFVVPLPTERSESHIQALRNALAQKHEAGLAGSGGGHVKVPSAKTEREMLLYIAKEIQDEWAHVFRDLMDDARVPLDDVQVLKAEIEENYKDAFLQACQCLERWRRAAGAFEVQRLRKVFESRHRKDLVNYMEARVNRVAGGAAQGRGLN